MFHTLWLCSGSGPIFRIGWFIRHYKMRLGTHCRSNSGMNLKYFTSSFCDENLQNFFGSMLLTIDGANKQWLQWPKLCIKISVKMLVKQNTIFCGINFLLALLHNVSQKCNSRLWWALKMFLWCVSYWNRIPSTRFVYMQWFDIFYR